MEEPIFSVMQTLVQRALEKTLADFLSNVKHYMGVHLHANAANRELQIVAQQQNKSVT
jgi:hypothetical protein